MSSVYQTLVFLAASGCCAARHASSASRLTSAGWSTSQTNTGFSPASRGDALSGPCHILKAPRRGTRHAILSCSGSTRPASTALPTALRSADPLFPEVGVTSTTLSPVARTWATARAAMNSEGQALVVRTPATLIRSSRPTGPSSKHASATRIGGVLSMHRIAGSRVSRSHAGANISGGSVPSRSDSMTAPVRRQSGKARSGSSSWAGPFTRALPPAQPGRRPRRRRPRRRPGGPPGRARCAHLGLSRTSALRRCRRRGI